MFANVNGSTYYDAENVDVKVKVYFTEGTSLIKYMTTLSTGNAYSINTTFAHIANLFDSQAVYFDILTKYNFNRISYIQRYVLINSLERNEQLFVSDNTLGGIDTDQFTKKRRHIPEYTPQTAPFEDYQENYRTDPKRYIFSEYRVAK